MFCLYHTQDAGRRLSPRDFQFVQTPRVAFDNARIHYEMDYRCYARQDVSGDLPQRKSANNDRFNPSNKYSGNSRYYTQNNSSCRKAAREGIPMSLLEYVIRVTECSQRTCNLKYDGYIPFMMPPSMT
ncbi:hypothetical protein J2067_000385 [Erwinia rhapontici]|nr:hypothetical protein [Erwinia rhapontici]